MLASIPAGKTLDELETVTPLSERVRAIKAYASQMQENWKILKAMIDSGTMDKFARSTEDDQQHLVMLPHELSPLPPQYDLTALYEDEDKSAPGSFVSGWSLPDKPESSELPDEKEFYATESEAKRRLNQLRKEDKQVRREESALVVRVPVDDRDQVSFNPKPTDYFQYQRVAEGSLKQAQELGSKMTTRVGHKIDGLDATMGKQAAPTEEDYDYFREICQDMKKAVEFWEKHIPSMQCILDDIYAQEGLLKRSVRHVSDKFKNLYQDTNRPREMRPLTRRLTERTLRQRLEIPLVKKFSMPELPPTPESSLTIGVIPPTPSDNGSSQGRLTPSSTGSPARTASPVQVSSDEGPN